MRFRLWEWTVRCTIFKTGTLSFTDELNARPFVVAKALAGYLEARSGDPYVFTVFVNNVHCSQADGAREIGEILGEIATAAQASL
jgi:D-alanyl-D-alanine carboxypeptidase